MSWEKGLRGALVNKNGHGFPNSLPLGDEVTLCVEVLVSVMAMGLGDGYAGQNSGGSNRCGLHGEAFKCDVLNVWVYARASRRVSCFEAV